MKLAAVFLVAISLGSLVRETNSRAATERGRARFEAKQYGEASQSFRDAARIEATPEAAFNLGTAEVAAGKRAEGSAVLAEAMKDPRLAEGALYNRGNSALAAKAFDHAIADYTAALRLDPTDAAAKRNLEIALAQRDASRSGGGGQGGGGGQQQQPPQQQQPSQSPPPQQPQARSQPDYDALLRSVQQQEEEERKRMNRPERGKTRVGW